MRITLLGEFRVVVDDQLIPDRWRLRKAMTLVKLLALAPRQRLQRDEILDLLWPELDPEAASNNLRHTLHVARQTIESAPRDTRCFLRWHGEQLRLAPEGAVWIDVVAFEAAAAIARRSQDLCAYEIAVDSYNGDLLPEDRYEDWSAVRRESLRETYLTLLTELARIHDSCRNHRQAVDALRRVIAVEPTSEEAHGALMRAYARIGQRRLALRQYQTLVDILRTEFDAEPDRVTQRLHSDIVAGQHADVDDPPIAWRQGEQSARRTNLPPQLTGFVGRQSELADLRRLIVAGRLLTIVGFGGSGKTRLALELASERIEETPDGTWLVELAALTDGSLIEQAIAQAIETTDVPGKSLRESLIDGLREKQTLIILDNCEHLIEPIAELVHALLSHCPGIRILATSREALGVPGEVIWGLSGLSLPNDAGSNLETIAATDAVGLFVDRARYRQPSFQLTTNNVTAIADICRRLEGIPLAIELAAARIIVLSPAEIALRLHESLGMLSSQSRLIVARHRGMRRVIDWSYQLLSDADKELFVTLSVFSGGWNLEAAEALAASTGHTSANRSDSDVLEGLSQLVDKSLVAARASMTGSTRYGLLAPVRQYGQEQLATRPNAERVHAAHTTVFTQLAEQAEPQLSGDQQRIWLERLETEHDNLRAALAWSIKHDRDLASRLVAALWRFWWLHGHLSEGQGWIDRVLAASAGAPVADRARTMQAAGSLAWAQGHYDRSLPYIEKSLALNRERGDSKGILNALSALGSVLGNQGEYVRASAAHEEGLSLARAIGDLLEVETALGNLADIAYYQGDYEAARTWWEESLNLQHERGGEYGVAIILNNLAEMARNQGDYDRSAPMLEEALAVFRTIDFKHGIAISLANLADVRWTLGDRASAVAHLRDSLAVARDLHNTVVSASCLDIVAKLLATNGDAAQAAHLLAAADAFRGAAGAELSPADRSILQPAIDTVRARIDEAIWLAASEAGAAMTAEQAMEIALAGLDGTSSSPSSTAMPELTAREREIALLVAQELTNRQISERLGTSNRTVDTHVGNILRKLNISSRAGLRTWTIDHGLVSTDE